MDIEARLIGRAEFPYARRLISHAEGRVRTADGWRVGIRVGDRLRVHDLERVLAGDPAPAAEFLAPWPTWYEHCGNAFAPDLSWAVFSEESRVHAVDAAGETRWEWSHADDPWGAYEEGSVLVTADGRQVWAVVPGDSDGQDWLVLSAEGTPLARTRVKDWRAVRSSQYPHPDGRHVALTYIDEDHSSLCWGVLDGELRTADAYSDEEHISDITAAGDVVCTVSTQGYWVRQCTFPDGDDVAEVDDLDVRAYLGGDRDGGRLEHAWSGAGYLDPATLIALCRSPGDALVTWLIGRSGLLGRVRYPDPAPTDYLWALADGTWLTADDAEIVRWTRS